MGLAKYPILEYLSSFMCIGLFFRVYIAKIGMWSHVQGSLVQIIYYSREHYIIYNTENNFPEFISEMVPCFSRGTGISIKG